MITDIEKDIIENLKKDIGYEGPKIDQQQFDNMVDYIIKEEKNFNIKELIWRLCLCYEGLNFNKVVDIFIDYRDSYYISELVSCVDGNLDQEYLVTKMIETDDLKFVKDAMSICFDSMLRFLGDEQIKKLEDFCNSKKD